MSRPPATLFCEATFRSQDIELPFLSGKKEDIIEMRSLLSQSGYNLAKMPQVLSLNRPES